MNRYITWALTLSLATTAGNAFAQNIGIGTTEPKNKLHTIGSMLVTAPSTATNAAPTPGQTRTMINGSNITINDSVGRIYDPGGPAGNYISNLSATAYAPPGDLSVIGFEITLEDVELGTGDSLIIEDSWGIAVLAVGNNYTTTGKWIFNGSELLITFKSNVDASAGRGFSLLLRRLYPNNAATPAVSGFAGYSLFFDAKTGSFRSGEIVNSEMGRASFGAGHNARVSGDYSIAMGYNTTASGDRSTALGSYVSTNGWAGSFSIGDASTINAMNSPASNNFRARFANGYRLYTSADYSTSCSLGAGDNAWTTTSDVRLKENFVPVDGEGILKKIAAMPLTTWNYKMQDPARFRHYGPMAQDFHAAFGRDSYGTIGSDTTINQADFDGVNFIAIQALEKRSAQQQAIIEVLLKEIEELKADRTRKKDKTNRRKKTSER